MATVNLKGVVPYAFAITPSDSAFIKADAANTKLYDTCFVYVLTTGNITVVTADGNQISFTGVPAHTILGGGVPIVVKQVRATGITGTYLGMVPTNGM